MEEIIVFQSVSLNSCNETLISFVQTYVYMNSELNRTVLDELFRQTES